MLVREFRHQFRFERSERFPVRDLRAVKRGDDRRKDQEDILGYLVELLLGQIEHSPELGALFGSFRSHLPLAVPLEYHLARGAGDLRLVAQR
jgi:hypothetical protein